MIENLRDKTLSIAYGVTEDLIKTKTSISFAESCTGGMLSSFVTDVPGASEILHMGYVVYNDEAKINCLNVAPETLESHTAVSPEVAIEMVEGLSENVGADISVSVTGLAGPSGGTIETPVGTVYVGFIAENFACMKKLKLEQTSREGIRLETCLKIFELIDWYLEEYIKYS